MRFLAFYDWSLFSTSLSAATLANSTLPNDPNSPKYSPNRDSWINTPFTFNGGARTDIRIADDDSYFQDGYVESGSAQTLTQAATINGVTYPAGSVVENEFSLIDASGNQVYVVRIAGVNVGLAYATDVAPVAGDVFKATSGLDGAEADNAGGTASSSVPYSGVTCFCSGTLILTPDGERVADSLRAGDLVCTQDTGAQPVVWCDRQTLQLDKEPADQMPICISAGSLGPNHPIRDLVVSPQHRMLIRGPAVLHLFGHAEVLAPAKGLLGLSGVRMLRGRQRVTYVHLLLARHAILVAEGAASESLYPGPQALAMMRPGARQQIIALCPGLRGNPIAHYGPTARPTLTRRQTERLVSEIRHGRHEAPRAPREGSQRRCFG